VITGDIPLNLPDPVVGVVPLRQLRFACFPVLAMPEITVYEHDHPRARKYNVGCTWKISSVLAIPESLPP
jgi:hypothetical protein